MAWYVVPSLCRLLILPAADDLKVRLMQYVKEKRVSALAIVTCVGSLREAKVRLERTGALLKGLTKNLLFESRSFPSLINSSPKRPFFLAEVGFFF